MARGRPGTRIKALVCLVTMCVTMQDNVTLEAHAAGGETVVLVNLLFTVPFTASTTNAMEINRAMTSSVDLKAEIQYYTRLLEVVLAKGMLQKGSQKARSETLSHRLDSAASKRRATSDGRQQLRC